MCTAVLLDRMNQKLGASAPQPPSLSTPLVNQFQWHVQPQSGQLMHVVADLTVQQCSLKWKCEVRGLPTSTTRARQSMTHDLH